MSKEEELEALTAECNACTACNLRKKRQNVVMGNGNLNASVAIIGEAPGGEEDKRGKPFQGDAGKRLDSLLPLAGLHRDEIYATNVCKCRPTNDGNKDRKPKASERTACMDFLIRELQIVKPELVILTGATPLQAFFGRHALVRDYHGEVVDSESLVGACPAYARAGCQFMVFPTYHPSTRARKYEDRLRSDLSALRNKPELQGILAKKAKMA